MTTVNDKYPLCQFCLGGSDVRVFVFDYYAIDKDDTDMPFTVMPVYV